MNSNSPRDPSNPPPRPPNQPLIEGEDFTIDEWGRYVFTREYHLKRGYCCKSGCRNCPYGFEKK